MTDVAGGQSLGARENQEDAFRIIFEDQETNSGAFLMLLADGMGGHAGGEIASNAALDAFAARFVDKANSSKPQQRLRDAMVAGNEAVRLRTEAEPALRGMGCTLLAALRIEDRLIWLSVGDSVLFLFRSGKLQRLNADHSLHGGLMEMVRAGKMAKEEADRHPNRNALRSAVTGEKIALVDANSIRLEAGDLVLLASDGLESLTDAQIEEVLRKSEKSEIAAAISNLLGAVETMNRPKQDNTTVVVHRLGLSRSAMTPATSWSEDPSAAAADPRQTYINLGLIGAGAAVLLALLVWFVAFQGTGEDLPTPEPTTSSGSDDGAIDNGSSGGISGDGGTQASPPGDSAPRDGDGIGGSGSNGTTPEKPLPEDPGQTDSGISQDAPLPGQDTPNQAPADDDPAPVTIEPEDVGPSDTGSSPQTPVSP